MKTCCRERSYDRRRIVIITGQGRVQRADGVVQMVEHDSMAWLQKVAGQGFTEWLDDFARTWGLRLVVLGFGLQLVGRVVTLTGGG